jgi:hypothetical protein
MTRQLPRRAAVCSLAAAGAAILLANAAAAWTTPGEAATQLRGKPGISIGESPDARSKEPFYTSIRLKRDWAVEPKDWLSIASLAREIPGTPYVKGKRHPLSIAVDGPVEAGSLAECFENLRAVEGSPFDVFLLEAALNRKALLALGAYPGLTGLTANYDTGEITDEDWAKVIAAWAQVRDLSLPPSAGRKAIAAASKSEHLRILKVKNTAIKAADLAPLRKHTKLQVLWVSDGSAYVEYLNQKGTGKWQVEKAERTD